LEGDKLDNKILLRSDGTSVYITQDIGTAIIREEEFHCKNYYYVVGNEQDYHFNVLALILQKMGFDWAKGIEHLSYGMVDLPSGKMKSREGTVVDADELMLEMKVTAQEISEELGKLEGMEEAEKQELFWKIGMGALKYFILKVDPKKRMLFDPKESVDFNGNTGPFIQNTHARIKSILRKSKYNGELLNFEQVGLDAEDISVIKQLYDFPEILNESAVQKSPAILANYTYELVKVFNHFYQNTTPIVKENDEDIKSLRLMICAKTAEVISNSMSLLGIEVPEKM
jgi:arginyl-tRNA synthetase